MLPTRADRTAKTEWAGKEGGREGKVVDFRGRNAERCFMSINGPRVLTLKVSSAVS